MESLRRLTSAMQYAYLQPLKVQDDAVNDICEDRQREVEMNGCTEGPALIPIKEEIVSKDLRSYFLGKDKLFDEPDSLPIIRLDMPVYDIPDDFALMQKNPRKRKTPNVQSSRKEHRRCSRTKKILERTIPCRSCDRKFATVGHMKIHAATHLRRRKKSCFVCGRRFSHGGALCLHMRSHKFTRSRK